MPTSYEQLEKQLSEWKELARNLDTQLRTELAECQAREKVTKKELRDLRRIACETRVCWMIDELLAQPTDDTALKAALAAERELCKTTCQRVSDSLNDEYQGDPSLKFAADECVNAISALGDKE